jgi:hypothetical protein
MAKIHLLLPAAILICGSVVGSRLFAASLNIDTDYRFRGVSYDNTDFDKKSSSDSAAYYDQRLRLSITGKPTPDIEIGARITAIGVAGSTSTLYPVPYPSTDFTPFIENAYVRLNNIAELPIDIVAGRQPMEYGDGLIVSDNGTGFTGIRLLGHTEWYVPLQAELFTVKIKENFRPGTDMDLVGGVGTVQWKRHTWEVGYFDVRDFSGAPYTRGTTAYPTKAIVQQFYDLRVGRKEAISSYQFEIAQEKGYVTRAPDNAQIDVGGLGYTASGELIGEKTKLGKVAAHALIAVFSGEANLGAFQDDNSFAPLLTRRYDGLERAGYGELFAATPADSFFTLPGSFSGIDTLNVGAKFTPLYAWTFGVDYFLYSASQGPKGAPTASGFERLFGAEFTLGVELDLSVTYAMSKFVDARFSYARYTPPKFVALWPSSEPASYYRLELAAKF